MVFLNQKVSVRQLQALLVLDVFGTGVIILPRRAAEYAGPDGWLVIVGMVVVALFYAFLITSAARLFPGDSFLSYGAKILSKPVAVLLSAGFVLKIVLVLGLELRLFCEIVQQTLLPLTPYPVVCLSMLAIGAFAAMKGYETRARIAEILFFVIFIPLLALFALGAARVDYTNLLPAFRTPPQQVALGALHLSFSFTGLEFCLLASPFLGRPQAMRKGALFAVVLIGCLMLFITVVTIARFGPGDVLFQIWPVLDMMDMVDLPGSFIERQDALIMSFWIVSIFGITNAGLFFASVLLKSLFPRVGHPAHILACIPVIYVLSILPRNLPEVYRILDGVFVGFGTVYLCVVPAVILLTAKLRKIGGRYDA